jgi:hypothetical protein
VRPMETPRLGILLTIDIIIVDNELVNKNEAC